MKCLFISVEAFSKSYMISVADANYILLGLGKKGDLSKTYL
jgi:hypothetical protein